MVQARFPDGAVPVWKNGASPGAVLADWMTRQDNPYFARAAVNRIWAYFFGTGLVEPVDDLTQEGGARTPCSTSWPGSSRNTTTT